MIDTADRVTGFRGLSAQDFMTFGLNDIAYVRAFRDDKGRDLYAVHAADGTPLVVIDERETAVMAIRQHEMEPVSVH